MARAGGLPVAVGDDGPDRVATGARVANLP
jgi:hypothetical protein